MHRIKKMQVELLRPGVRGLLALANANNGDNAGSFALNANNAPSNANVNYGAALNFNISQYGVFALRSRQQGQTSPHGETYT